MSFGMAICRGYHSFRKGIVYIYILLFWLMVFGSGGVAIALTWGIVAVPAARAADIQFFEESRPCRKEAKSIDVGSVNMLSLESVLSKKDSQCYKFSQNHKQMMKTTPPPKLTIYDFSRPLKHFSRNTSRKSADSTDWDLSPLQMSSETTTWTLLEQRPEHLAKWRCAALRGHGLLSGDLGFHQWPSFCCHPSAVGSGGGCAIRRLERWQSATLALW